MSIVVEPCTSPAAFLDAQRGFYRDDPHYVPPLTAYDKHQLDAARHPFFQHADCGFWLARRGGAIVGRISATRDRLHDEFHGDRVGFFGHFEATDEAAAHAVLQHAADWLRERSATAFRGPVDLSTNYRCGLLIDGEPGPPFVMMPHNPPVYAAWIESFGCTKAKDLLALHCDSEQWNMPRTARIAKRARAGMQIETRRIDLRRFEQEVQVLWSIYTSAWEQNWGFAPMTRAEFVAEAKNFRSILRPEITVIAMVNGIPAGMAIGVPDVNVGIRACNGRLWPLGWWKFTRAMRRVKTFRSLTLGVRAEYRNTGLASVLLAELVQSGIDCGLPVCEASWILEDNRGMLRPLELAGAKPFRRYRIFERELQR